MFAETTIKPCSSGFGMYEPGEYNGDKWEDETDLINEMGSNVELFELGTDELPEGMDDIRGNIRNEPDRVFGYLYETGGGEIEVYYVGVSEI